MSAITIDTRAAQPAPEGRPAPDIARGGLVLSGALHAGLLAVILFGLPNLFRAVPPQATPIAVNLVTIAPQTRATHPNPFRPHRNARPIPAKAPPVPKPKPEPHPQPAAAAPPSSAPPPPPPPPKPEPVAAKAPPPPPPKPTATAREKPKPSAPPVQKTDARAFERLLDKLDARPVDKHEPQQAAQFDTLLKNLAHEDTATAEDAPPSPQRVAAAAEASSQPQAPLGSQLTASEKDLVIQQIERCWDVPAGARDAKDLVVEIKASVNPDGTVRDATIVDTSRYATDPFFRAAADSAKRAVLNPQCTGPQDPLKLPADEYQAWRNLDLFFNPKDLL
jgi:outer membrane biosynthesis protein TonB